MPVAGFMMLATPDELVPMAGAAAWFGVQPGTAGGAPEGALPSVPLMWYGFELGTGWKIPAAGGAAEGPSNDKAPGGGVMLSAAVSEWPMRRLPCGVIASEVIMYRGPTCRPACCAVGQSAYPSELAVTSWLLAELYLIH